MTERILGEGRFLRLVLRGGWELVDRVGVTAIVGIVAVTREGEIVLVEQYREPVRSRVIELPAGLVGDEPETADELLVVAAARELEEETGFRAEAFEVLSTGPPSAGCSSEVVTLLAAHGLESVGPGGGVGSEAIVVHRVPLDRAAAWLAQRQAEGKLIDPKVWAGLYFVRASAPVSLA